MAIQISIERVKNQNLELFSILQYCGYLGNENIPLDLITQVFRVPEKSLKDIEIKLKTLMVGNNSYSLLKYSQDTGFISIHRTTQDVIRRLITPSVEVINIIRQLVALMLRSYPYDEYSIQRTKRCQKMEPHFLALKEHITSNAERATVLFTERLQLLLILGQLDCKFSQYPSAIQHLESALDLIQRSKNANLEIQVQILLYLGVVKKRLAEYPEACRYLRQALEIYTTPDLHRARICTLLGDVLRVVDATQSEAQEMHQYAESIYKEYVRNSENSSRESSLTLGHLYLKNGDYLRNIKDYASALTHYEEALKIAEQYLGESEPMIAHIHHGMGLLGLDEDAEVFVDRGVNYEKSLKHLDQFLSDNIKCYGPYHSYVATAYESKSQLLYLSHNQADWDSALQDINQAIQILIQIFGPRYVNLIVSYYYKGKILEKLGRYTEARDAYQESLEISQDHPGERISWTKLANARLKAPISRSSL